VSAPTQPVVGSEAPTVKSTEPIQQESQSLPKESQPATSTKEPFRFFSSASIWNTPLSPTAAIDPSSQAVVSEFGTVIARDEALGEGPWINTTNWSVPVYTVPGNQPRVIVTLANHAPDAALSSAWSAVPIPSGAIPAVGTDGTLVVWQPSTDELWEFHRLVHTSRGWSATWGGVISHVSESSGAYGPSAYAGAGSWWGISASAVSLMGGLITLEDFALGHINHALEMAIPNVRGGVYASPAQRSDGRSPDPLALPEGSRLRLNPSLNLAALHLPPVTLMLAEAAQRYGILITDSSRVPEIFAQDPTPTGSNPYLGAHGYFEGKYPDQLLASFPWSQLQLLKLSLHSTE
jgi:hypothetical protein